MKEDLNDPELLKMKNLSESEEVKNAYLQIDLHYLQIETARMAFEKKFNNMSEVDKQIADASGAMKSEGDKFVATWEWNLSKIVEYKEIIGADPAKDKVVLKGLRKMLPKVN